MNPFTILTRLGLFAGTTALGALLTFAATQLTQPGGIQSAAGLAPDVLSTPAPGSAPGPGGALGPVFAAFNLVPASPKPVPSAEPAVLQLIAQQAADSAPSANGIPRIPPVSQFDGSPLQGANCNLAAGAMLARLGWGIVTTGGILRPLQDDQQGGTDLGDLATALWRGYGVSPSWGGVTRAQLRGLIGGGYGAVVHGLYGMIKHPYNIQPSFTGPHAIYIDAYYPGSERTAPAYYVIDPLHKPTSGYRGEWMPATLVEAFALALGPSDRIMAAWAFPVGGTPPVIADIGPLPTGGGVSPKPGDPPPDPADPPITLTVESGDTTVELAPVPPSLDGPVQVDGTLLPKLDICVILPKPIACPGGIIGRYGIKVPTRPGSFFPTIDIRFVDSVKPNVVLVGFTISTPGPGDVQYWRADGTGGVHTAGSYSSVSLPGSGPVRIAHLATAAATKYRFQVVAGGIIGARSPVGTFTTGAGVKALDMGLLGIERPVIGLDSQSPVYSRIRSGTVAQPVLPCADATGGKRILLGGQPFCLPDVSAPAPASCVGVKVGYEVVGMTGDQVAVRAIPTVGTMNTDGSPAEETIIEAIGPPGAGEVTLGCLTPGITYEVAVDIPGDPLGPLVTRSIVAPSS